MAVLLTVAGLGLVVLALRDIFHTLWHPRGFGSLARLLFSLTWWLTRPLNRRQGRMSELSGPLGLLLTVMAWAGLMVIGFALAYLPRLPDGFVYSAGLDPQASSGIVAAVYVSLVTLATLGFGDVVPATDALRLLVPMQALVGFVLLTAAISWVLQVYPALTRRRTLARRLMAMVQSGTMAVVREGTPSVASQLLSEVTAGLSAVEVDLMQHAESYFFRERDARHSLAASAPYLLDLAQAGRASTAVEVRHAATMLLHVVVGLAETLKEDYLKSPEHGSTAAVLLAWTDDHEHAALRERSPGQAGHEKAGQDEAGREGDGR